MAKIAFIGAGSTVFAKNLLGDILSFPELANSQISLMDIDPERLKTSEIMVNKLAKTLNAKPKIKATTNRRQALKDAVESEKEIAAAHGVYNFSPTDHFGIDERGRVMITVKNGEWELIK